MLPVTFETFLEQGASTIDASVRELQRTYDEVVWGIESPPSYIEKKDTPELHPSSKNKNKNSKNNNTHGNGFPGRHIRRRGRTNSNPKNRVQTTPSTATDADSLFREDDSSIETYQESTTSPTTATLTSASESEIATRKRRTTPAWQSRPPVTRAESPSYNSILAVYNEPPKQLKPPSSISGIMGSRLKHKLEHPRSKAKSRSIDEIFGYNTRQTITRRKAFADQDVGLDFCLLDAPTGSRGGTRSLLIVQGINPNGLFANTGLGVGDAVLAINGVPIREEEQGRGGRGFGQTMNNNNNKSNFKPNIFKARALLNGRGLVVSIDYQKFGETSNHSICSNSLEETMGKFHNVRGMASVSGPAIASAAAVLNQGYPLVREPMTHSPKEQRNSLYRSRRQQQKGPRPSARVDFAGGLLSEHGLDLNATAATESSSTSTHSEEPSTLPRNKNSNTANANAIHPSVVEDSKLDTGGGVNVSTSSSATTKTNNTTERFPLDEGVVSKSENDEPENPPKISRLTRLKARTLKLRSSFSSSQHGKKDHSKNNSSSNNNKENAPNQELLAPVAIPAIPHESETTDLEAASPYQSLLSNNNGPEEQMKLLKERVHSNVSANSQPSPARSVPGVEAGGVASAFHSPARSTKSTHSESYLTVLRRELSPMANEILDDLSLGAMETRQRPSNIPSGSASPGRQPPPTSPAAHNIPKAEDPQQMIRINRRVYHKLQIRIDCLQRSNARLTDEVSALRRGSTADKLQQALKQLEAAAAQEKVFEADIGLLRSRLDIANIQADKRHRELEESKEKLIAHNDKVISDLSKRIEQLQGANRRLLEQLKKQESKKQEKISSLQTQFDRLKMKFSAQSTLLDNVMTSNEQLTSENKALESELNAGVKPLVETVSADSAERSVLSPTMFLAEASEYDNDHIKRDPILLAQAKELSSLREQNADLEDRLDSLSSELNELKLRENLPVSITPVKESSTTKAGLSPIREGVPRVVSPASTAATSETTPCLLDKTFSSSGEEDDSLCTSSHHRRRRRSGTRPPRPRRRSGTSTNPNNVSIDNPSDESTGFNVSLIENPSDEHSAFGTGAGCLPQLRSPSSSPKRRDPAATTYKLKYQHEYEDLARLEVEDDDDDYHDADDDDDITTNTSETRTTGHRWDGSRYNHQIRSPPFVNESFDSTNSLALMERILELETALQGAEDLDPEQARQFISSLQSRMAKLNKKGYERVGTVEVVSSNEDGSVSVEVTEQ